MRKIVLLLAVYIAFLNLKAQNKPFPQSETWDNVIKPTNYSQAQLNEDVSSYYEHWKANYLTVANTGGYYIQGDNTGGTQSDKGTSEGHGYGMLITALMAGYDNNAKTYFDGLYSFFDSHRSSINNELMGWLVDANERGSGTYSSAADGDMDVAYALLLAHYQWGSSGAINYLQEAKDMITLGIKEDDMNANTKRVMLGDWDNNSLTTRPSDWMTSHMHAYYDATQDNFWNVAATEVYSMMGTISNNAAANTGLMPDFVTGNPAVPSAPNFLEGPYDGEFYYNAARFPWRIAMDFGHYGSSSSKNQLNKVMSWLKSNTQNNPSNIRAGYFLNGNNISGNGYQDATFISPMIAAATVDASHQNYLNAGWTLIRNKKNNYFADNINLLCMLYISGNWWVPEDNTVSCLTNLEIDDVVICESSNATIETQLSTNDYGFTWKKDNQTLSETESSLIVSSEGMYTVTVSSDGCNAITENVNVTSSIPAVANEILSCSRGEVQFLGDREELKWYDNSDNLLFEGRDFSTLVYSDSVFRVGVSTFDDFELGATDKNTTGWYNDESEFSYQIIFNVEEPVNLEYVTLYSEGSQTLDIELRNASNQLVKTKTVTLQNGSNRIALGFDILQGNNYSLGVANQSANLWVNNEGDYPYEKSGVVKLLEAKTDWGTEEWMAYFFKWEFSSTSSCVRQEVSVNVDEFNDCITSLFGDTVVENRDFVYPNPFQNNFTCKVEKPAHYRITDLNGELIEKGTINPSVNKPMGNELLPGLYLLTIYEQNETKVIRITKI